MNIDYKSEIAALHDETIALRRDIHAHPELGFQEERTAALIEARLKELDIPVRRIAGTGIVGVLKGDKPGNTVMLRCELDALPITEDNDLPFRSKNPGVMHACGHDCHAAITAQIAKILAAHRSELPGTVVFMFQPDEEGAGAMPMIEGGALEDPRPNAILGLHVWSPYPFGKVAMCAGPMNASSYYFKITIHGKDTSGYEPEKGVSPISCAAHVLQAIDTMQAMEFNAVNEPTLITVGMIHAGNYMINIPDACEIQGSIRCLHEDEKRVHERFRALVVDICKSMRCTADVEIECGNTMLSNDEKLFEMGREVVTETLGPDAMLTKGVRGMGGDDLAEFFNEGIPGLYYMVGMGSPEKGTTVQHHNKDFLVDEDILDIALELQLKMAVRFLEEN